MSLEKVLSLQAAVRGFHFYKSIWEPADSEVLSCLHEENNPYNPFAIKTCQLNSDRIVGHLPIEISRNTKFILDRGAKLEVKLRETHYRRSPLVQGGLEIPCDLELKMPNTMRNAAMLKKYLELFEDRYEEPQEIVILGTFSKTTAATGSVVTTGDKRKNDQGNHAKEKSAPLKIRRGNVKSHDIRSIFKKQKARATATDERPAQEEDSVVILD